MNKITIVVAQSNFLVGDIKGNAKRILHHTQIAKEKYNADLVIFPELALAGYPPEDLLFRPGFYRRCDLALDTLAKEITDTAIIVGYPKKIKEHAYNMAALIRKGKIEKTYAKFDLPNYEVFDEKRYFSPGTDPCVFTLKGIKMGLIICEDLWHPQPAKLSIKQGAELLISINASPFDRYKVRARESMLKQRVSEHHVPIIYGNIVGGQDEVVFDGGSMVIDAQGERVIQAAYYKEDMMVVEIEANKSLKITPKKLPNRITEEENVYKTLLLGVHDYIHKNHFPGAIIGLSGGIDSALTLAIAADAIGADKVRAVMMPSRYTASMSLEDAKKQAKQLKVQYDIIEIEPMFKAFLHSLAPEFKDTVVDTTEENIQARIRGTLLMALSNKFGSIVLTTGNKSEFSVGYATLYGDMAGGFSVLKDIPKTWVYRLAEYRNTLSPAIPQRAITREPSAELAEGQIDEDNLPPYAILDDIIDRYVDKDEDPIHIVQAGLNQKTVARVIKLINQNEYKRRQAPIGIRVSHRAFGKDRRYPITSGYTQNIWD